jgi:hypothetical protein
MHKDLREHGRIILAHGEVTGHCHEVVCDVAADLDQAQYFEEPDGRRVLMALMPCVLQHEEHGRIRLDPSEAARGAAGERDAGGRLIGQARQGDVCLHPIALGTWQVIRQREGYSPETWRQVAD